MRGRRLTWGPEATHAALWAGWERAWGGTSPLQLQHLGLHQSVHIALLSSLPLLRRPPPQVRSLISQELSSALQTYDALLSPAAPTLAYGVGEKSADPLAMYLGDLATVNVNLAGLPALVLPVAYAPAQVRGGLAGFCGRPLVRS